MKKLLLPLILLFTFVYSQAMARVMPDSVGIRKMQGKTFIVHEIEAAEGWFSIARRYKITYAELRMANKDSADKLVPGRTLLVPVAMLKADDPYFDKNYLQQEANFYQVKEGESLYSIAKKFSTSVDSLKKWNQLSEDRLLPGQHLKVGSQGKSGERQPGLTLDKQSKTTAGPVRDSAAAGVKKVSKPFEPGVAKPIKEEKLSETKAVKAATDSTKLIKTAGPTVKPGTKKSPSQVAAKGRREVNESGIASWIRDDDINPNKYYALHRSAPIGTIIRVTNKMNNKYVFVKVVGSLPDTGDNTDLLIKISKASAEKIGVHDSRFQCDLNYGLSQKP